MFALLEEVPLIGATKQSLCLDTCENSRVLELRTVFPPSSPRERKRYEKSMGIAWEMPDVPLNRHCMLLD